VIAAVGRSWILLLGVARILTGLFVLLRPNTPATGPQTRELDLRIRDGAMIPSEATVAEGDRVVLRMTTDSPLEVHLHGYDVERGVEPGEPTELSLRAKLTGRFTIENHETEEELGMLVVRPR
jgi:hypothetical protein